MNSVLLNMCVLTKEDINKFNRVFNTISATLKNIYADMKTLNSSINTAGRNLSRFSTSTDGNVSKNSASSSVLDIMGNANTLHSFNQNFLKGTSLGGKGLATSFMRALGPLAIAGMGLNKIAESTSEDDKNHGVYIDKLATDLNQTYKKMDALANLFKIKGGVDLNSFSHLLLNLKEGATDKNSKVYETLKNLGIEMYDKNGNTKDMVTLLSVLANKLENMSDQKASEVKLALNLDSNSFNLLKKGQGNFLADYQSQEKIAQDSRPLAYKEKQESQDRWEQAKQQLRQKLIGGIGEFWIVTLNRLHDIASNLILDPPDIGGAVESAMTKVGEAELAKQEIAMAQADAMAEVISGFFSSLWRGAKKIVLGSEIERVKQVPLDTGFTFDTPLYNGLLNGQAALSNAQQNSQLLAVAENKTTISNNNKISYQNNFNITSNNPEEVARIVDDKMRVMNQEAGEHFDNGVLA